MKQCKICNNFKSLDQFYKKQAKHCKVCRSVHRKAYYQEHKERELYLSKQNYLRNKDQKIKNQKEYREINREKISETKRIYVNKRVKIDIQFRLKRLLRTRLYGAIKQNTKVGSAIDDMGCSVEDLKAYLESKFIAGMTWENWGKKEGQWSIDHIVPLSSFDLTDREQFLLACHYTTLQPLWHRDNLMKSDS